MAILLFFAGLAFLIVGAELLVRGATRLAALLGISPLVIGLTVVAFGTSAPELAVSVKSAVSGQAGIALGNVVGSNIFNVLFILGISALIVPLVVSRQLLRFDVPLMVALSLLVLFLSLDGRISRMEGAMLLLGLCLYVGSLIYISRWDGAAAESEPGASSWFKNSILVLAGLALLVIGSRWLVESAVAFAAYLGVSELVVGLTIVAAGTSLPEVVTSLIAAIRGERDIAVGNIVGSNLFNIMGVLGVASVVSPFGMEVSPSALRFDMPVMAVAALACLPLFFTGGIISRKEGALLLSYYVAYTVYLIMASSQHAMLPGYSAVMLYFVIPPTVIILGIVVLQEMQRRRTP